MTTSTGAIDATSVCSGAFRGLSYSRLDTLDTQTQIRLHNARRNGFCKGVADPGKPAKRKAPPVS